MKIFVFIMSLVFCASAGADITLWGRRIPVGDGTARTFIQYDLHGPEQMGVVLTGKALDDLPSKMDMYTYILPMPRLKQIPPYKYVMLNWNPRGHDPVQFYGVPHFDFHFYSLANNQRLQITCAGADEALCMKQPAPDMLPQFYAPTPAGVPQMGWHWFDTRSPEFHGKKFTSTFIYGYYNGQLAFVEPMITREFLLSHPTFSASTPVPAKVAEAGYYSQSYSIHYDSLRDLYYVSLSHFTKRSP